MNVKVPKIAVTLDLGIAGMNVYVSNQRYIHAIVVEGNKLSRYSDYVELFFRPFVGR